MIEFPLWFGGLGWLTTVLFWMIVTSVFYLIVKWLNKKL